MLFQLGLGITAQGTVTRVEGNIFQVIQAAEQRYFGKFAHPREESKADMGIVVFDYRIQVTQAIAHFRRHAAVGDIVEKRFVVFIH